MTFSNEPSIGCTDGDTENVFLKSCSDTSQVALIAYKGDIKYQARIAADTTNCSPELLTWLAQIENNRVRKPVAENPNTPAKTIKSLIEHYFNIQSSNTIRKGEALIVASSAIQHPSLDIEFLQKIVAKNNSNFNYFMLRNPVAKNDMNLVKEILFSTLSSPKNSEHLYRTMILNEILSRVATTDFLEEHMVTVCTSEKDAQENKLLLSMTIKKIQLFGTLYKDWPEEWLEAKYGVTL